MPNYCEYEMKVRGKKENCQKWLQKMKSYDEPNHFWRMFDPIYISDEGGTDDDYFMVFAGDCAWSLETCCRDSGYSGGVDLFEVNTRELHLKMEAYSSEPGCEFQEHYIYIDGECEVDDCVEWHEWYYDESDGTFEEWKKMYGLPDYLSEDAFDEDGYYHEGGFSYWGFHI